MDSLQKLITCDTAQTEPVFNKKQVKNNAGGYVFEVTPHVRLERSILLGTDGGTFYVNEKTLTRDNTEFLFQYIQDDPQDVLDTVVDILVSGRAVRRNAALFTLAALTHSDNQKYRLLALEQVSLLITTGSDLFLFMQYVTGLGGFGRSKRRYISKWYLDKNIDALALQLVKYRQRNGWTHRDVLRLAHPKTSDPVLDDVFAWVTRQKISDNLPDLIKLYNSIAYNPGIANVLSIVTANRVPWEILPTEVLTSKEVWIQLVKQGLPIGALLSNISRLEKIGVFEDIESTDTVVDVLTNPDRIVGSKIHPIKVLYALYGYRGRGETTSVILDALDTAFYLSFKNLPTSDARILIGLDVSGSMDFRVNHSVLTSRDISAAMAMTLVHSYKNTKVCAFTDTFTALSLSKKQRLDDVVERISDLDFGSTDCAQPMLYAIEKKLIVDTFIIFTDNETYYGKVHPFEALKKYRQTFNPKAKLIVAATEPTAFTIADPSDAGMLDIVGFDAAIPQLIDNFINS